MFCTKQAWTGRPGRRVEHPSNDFVQNAINFENCLLTHKLCFSQVIVYHIYWGHLFSQSGAKTRARERTAALQFKHRKQKWHLYTEVSHFFSSLTILTWTVDPPRPYIIISLNAVTTCVFFIRRINPKWIGKTSHYIVCPQTFRQDIENATAKSSNKKQFMIIIMVIGYNNPGFAFRHSG